MIAGAEAPAAPVGEPDVLLVTRIHDAMISGPHDGKPYRMARAAALVINARVAALEADNERLRRHVADLLSGMWVNCVYCGHRYGPGETTPVSMSDALKAHAEQCPQHPMSALRGRVAALEAELAEARRAVLMLEENGRHESERIATAVRAEAERAAGAVALLRRINALELDNWPLAKNGFVDARDELTAEVSGWLKDHDAKKRALDGPRPV